MVEPGGECWLIVWSLDDARPPACQPSGVSQGRVMHLKCPTRRSLTLPAGNDEVTATVLLRRRQFLELFHQLVFLFNVCFECFTGPFQ